jgi:hypothetical protein
VSLGRGRTRGFAWPHVVVGVPKGGAGESVSPGPLAS